MEALFEVTEQPQIRGKGLYLRFSGRSTPEMRRSDMPIARTAAPIRNLCLLADAASNWQATRDIFSSWLAAKMATVPESAPTHRTVDASPEPVLDHVPRPVLAVASAWLVLLIAAFVCYERIDAFADFVSFDLRPLPFGVIWFGAVGGSLISAQGIFKNNRAWRRSYDYWHYARPLLGALMGTLGCLVLIVLNEAATKTTGSSNPVFYDVVALAIGYREESFRSLLTSLIDTLILPGGKKPGASQGPSKD
jgi:hypothetical protein